jgi:hypothetical protein
MLKNKIILLGSIAIFFQNVTIAQTSNIFSNFGLGTYVKSEFVPLESMGGISGAYNSLIQINTSNPASYATLTRTSFEIGAYGQKSWLKSNNDSETQTAGNLQYFSMAFPLLNNNKKGLKLALATALLPNNKLEYDISTNRLDAVSGDVLHEFIGKGAINQALLGFGAKYNSLALGFNASYIFGNEGKARKSFYNDIEGSTIQYFFEEATYRGIKLELGAQYDKIFQEKKVRLRAGTNIGFNNSLNKEGSAYYIRQVLVNGSTVNVDTPSYSNNLKQKVRQPLTTNNGIILSRDGKWLVGFNYKTWSFEKSTNSIEQYYKDAYLLSIGGEYIPEISNSFSYIKTVRYRLGAFLGKDPLYVNKTQMNTKGITFGLGLPIKKDASLINIGATLGSKGTTSNGLIKDNYLKASIGITFSDLWFLRPKYD